MGNDGGVFGVAGGQGLGSMLPSDVPEGFEDLTGGAPAMTAPMAPPGTGQPIPAGRGGGYAPRMAGPYQGVATMGMGQGEMLPATCSCSKFWPMLMGMLLGAALTGAGYGAYRYFRR